MNGIEKLQETVRKIYEESEGITAFGAVDTTLPPEWEEFFQRKSQELRKQEPEPEPEPEPKKEPEAKPDVLPQILEGIIKRIEGIESKVETIESRLDLIEAIDKEVEEQIQEPMRKGLDPEISLMRGELLGLSGEFRDREGRKWIES